MISDATFSAILAMTIATIACRWLGFYLMAHITPSPRIERAFATLPGAIAAAVAFPIFAKIGWVGMLAAVVAIITMLRFRRDFIAVIAALSVIAGLRLAGF